MHEVKGQCSAGAEGGIGALSAASAGAWDPLQRGHLILGSADYTIRKWSADSVVTIKTFSGHTSTVNCVALNADRMFVCGVALEEALFRPVAPVSAMNLLGASLEAPHLKNPSALPEGSGVTDSGRSPCDREDRCIAGQC